MASFTVTPAGAYSDPGLKSLMDGYRRVVAQRYTPSSVAGLPKVLSAPPYYVSRKFDGELWFLISRDESNSLVAANGRVMTGDIPVLTAGGLVAGTVLAGELHVDKQGSRERVGDVRTALSSTGEALQFSAFDVILHDGITWQDSSYPQRLEILQTLLPAEGAVRVLPVTEVDSESEVSNFFEDVTAAGGEGIVVRCSDGRALKVKPEFTIDFAVLGYTLNNASGQDQLRSILLGLAINASTFVPISAVGSFEADVDRDFLVSLLKPLAVASDYRKAASTGQLYQMVRPEILVESRLLDLQSEDARGRIIRLPELMFVDDLWSVVGQVPAVTAINAVVTRVRDDKANVADGARWAQIEHVVSAPAALTGGRKSEVLRRQVWTKETKGKVDVRKLVVWRTNKEAFDPSYPPYVVHWTDYSAGRKTPLTREVRPAATAEAAETLADSMIAENIKKGWELKV